jgi:hypothetical protein
MYDAMGNHCLIIMDIGPPGSLTLTARTGLSPKHFSIRIKTLLQDFTKLGELGEPMADPFVEHFFFSTTTAGHSHLRITHSTPPQDGFNIAKLYEIGEVSHTRPSTARVDTWPKGADVSTATYSGKSHSSDTIFTEHVKIQIPPSAAASATATTTNSTSAGIVLDPLFSGLDYDQISLDLYSPE